MVGILLDKIGVPYHIYQRSLKVKPSVAPLTPCIKPS
jgi:hypothetical protein